MIAEPAHGFRRVQALGIGSSAPLSCLVTSIDKHRANSGRQFLADGVEERDADAVAGRKHVEHPTASSLGTGSGSGTPSGSIMPSAAQTPTPTGSGSGVDRPITAAQR